MAWEDYISVNLDGYVSLFKILGDPVCLAVAGLLFEHEATATTIAMALELSPAKVRRSLEVLERAEIVTSRWRDRSRAYRLTTAARGLMTALGKLG
jgi:DNA-binding transcriptional ArsR family regulator